MSAPLFDAESLHMGPPPDPGRSDAAGGAGAPADPVEPVVRPRRKVPVPPPIEAHGPALDGKLRGYVDIVNALGDLSVRDAQQLRRHRQLSRQGGTQ